jgi:Uma2 family endonuclease
MTPTTPTESPNICPNLAGTRRFTSAEHHRLIEAGILGTEDKVELLDGYIVYMADFVDLPPADGPFGEWRLLRRWTSAEYHRMIELGVIGEDERLELLDGYLALKVPQNPPHRGAVTRLTYRLPPQLPGGWLVMTHCPCVLGDMSPEPDGVIVRGGIPEYLTRDPMPPDFGIVIEVSDSTLEPDRAGKGRLYARAGLPVYWIVNVADRRIEIYTDPDPAADPPAYRTRTDYRPGAAVPITLDGRQVAMLPVADVIP